jgi:hypothetical protein
MLVRPTVFRVPVPRHKQARKQRGTGTRKTEGRTSMNDLINSNFLIKQLFEA